MEKPSIQTQASQAKRTISKLSLVILTIAILSMSISAYSAYRVSAAFSGQFPGAQQLNIVATYSLGGVPGAQSLSAGSTGNFTLSVYYAGSATAGFDISYNSTNPGDFDSCCVTAGTIDHHGITVGIAGQSPISPTNSPYFYKNTAALVTLNHGQNTIHGTIAVDPSFSNIQSYVIQWFASSA